MRVLWICNIMLPLVAGHLGVTASNKEGWLSGLSDVILERQRENGIVLGVAFPVEKELDGYQEEIRTDFPEGPCLSAFGFYEDVKHAERYDTGREKRIAKIFEAFRPDVVHCFGTEYGHTLAAVKTFAQKKHVLLSIQGLCTVCAQAYMADIPEKVQNDITLRDFLRRDSLRQQRKKFMLRGEREIEVIRRVFNIAGRTGLDAFYASLWNPEAAYYHLNETLRSVFYEGSWPAEDYEPYTVFVSQGDYPLKGLHYLLRALPIIREQYPQVKAAVAGDCLVSDKSLKDKIKLSAYGKYLKKLIREYRLEDAVSFTGRLTAEEMKERYLKSGVYVCCSSMENSPNSLGEAMLLGMPCVAADAGGIPSLFAADKDGILYRGFRQEDIAFYGQEQESVPASDRETIVAKRLAEAVIQMFRSGEKQRMYCQNAKVHAGITHDREKNYRDLLKIYAEIAAK